MAHSMAPPTSLQVQHQQQLTADLVIRMFKELNENINKKIVSIRKGIKTIKKKTNRNEDC